MEKSNAPSKINPKSFHINEALGCLVFVLVAQTISCQWLLMNGFIAGLSRGVAILNPYLNDKFISFADNPEKFSATHTLSIMFSPVFLMIFLRNYKKTQPASMGKRVISVIFLTTILLMPIFIDPTKGRRLSRIIFNDGIVGVFFGMAISMLIAAIIFGTFSIFFDSLKTQGEKQ
ncbi:hypothetical protein [Aquabacterium sp.]|uniref:hypothetical protein n=1 Tax=Aquabacterium sp. TaxID=1872578 RepID=UPI002489756C|nr:hypothetical protein [Aquabacterium sp.]MDI1350343.1 hypothetical protein [Aquabacterium sp.]